MASRKRQPPATASAPSGTASARRIQSEGQVAPATDSDAPEARRRPNTSGENESGRLAARDAETATGPSSAPSIARRIERPESVAGTITEPARRSRGAPSDASNRALAPPFEASGKGPVGRPTHETSASTAAAGSETSRNAVADVNSRANRGARAERSRPSERENVSRNGFPPSGVRSRLTVAASAGPSSSHAPSWSSNSHARRQKYERVRSSRSTGSETTRATPSWSMKKARPAWIP